MPAGITALSMNIDSTNIDAESTETNNLYTRTYEVDATSNENYLVTLDPTGTNWKSYQQRARLLSPDDFGQSIYVLSQRHESKT